MNKDKNLGAVLSSWWIKLIMSITVGIGAFLLYTASTDHEFVFCDDNIFVYDFQPLNSGTYAATLDTTFGTSYYRPVLGMSLVFDYRKGVDEYENNKRKSIEAVDSSAKREYALRAKAAVEDPKNYLETNLWLHVLCSVLVYWVFIILGYNSLQSFVFAVIFATHPILTPAVSWVSGRNDSLLSLFFLPSFILFILYERREAWDWQKIILLISHLTLFLVAIFTKEIAVMLPFVALAYLLLFVDKKIFTKSNFIAAAGWFVIGGIWYAYRAAAMAKIPYNPDLSGFEAYLVNFRAIPSMIGKLFLPDRLAPLSKFEPYTIGVGYIFIVLLTALIYWAGRFRQPRETWKGALVAMVASAVLTVSWSLIHTYQNYENIAWELDLAFGITSVLISIIVLFFMYGDKSSRRYMFGLIWFIFILMPSLFVRIQYVDDFFDYAEHRAYLPMLGIMIVLLEVLKSKRIKLTNPLPASIAVVLVMFLVWRTTDYQEVFEDRKAFWGHNVVTYPDNPRGYLDMGKAYLAKAIDYRKEGNSNMASKEYNKAEEHYLRGIQLNPENINLYLDLTSMYLATDREEQAYEYAKKSISLPRGKDDKIANINMANILVGRGQFTEALPFYQKAVNKNPNPQLWLKYAQTAERAEQRIIAGQAYEVIARLKPGLHEIHYASGRNYAMSEQYDQAISQLMTALNIFPKHIPSNEMLMRVYLSQGNREKALLLLESINRNNITLSDDLKNIIQQRIGR